MVHPVFERCGLVIACVSIALLALAAPVTAASVTINPGDSLATAITNAGSGGTVILNPGVYYQSGISTGNDVTLQANTSYGSGPWDTIIDGSRSGNSIFTTSGHSLTLDNLTIRNGVRSATTTSSAGGAIHSTSGNVKVMSSTFTGCSANNDATDYGARGGAISTSYGSVTVISSTFTGCSAHNGNLGGARGGAIYSDGGSVTVTSSTFTGCSVTSGSGGGALGGAIYTDSGIVTVTSGTFTGCSASSVSGVAYGGAIHTDTETVTATSSTFTGCSANGVSGWARGGAINTLRGTIHFCRFYQSTPGTTVYSYSSVNAANTWWGTAGGPSPSDIHGPVTAGTWLVPGVTASPPSITPAGTATIVANLTFNSAGTDTSAYGHVTDGTPVTFTATGGTVSPAYAVTGDGIAMTRFTPSGPGTATITATVDNESVSIPVTVATPAAGTNVTSIEVDPVQPATVYAGIDGQGVYRSPDSGSSWDHLTLPGGANLRIRALAPVRLAGSPATTLYAGSYGGGVYYSTDGGTTWNSCGVIPNQNVLSLVANSTAGVYAGTESGLYASTDGCSSWTAVNNGLP